MKIKRSFVWMVVFAIIFILSALIALSMSLIINISGWYFLLAGVLVGAVSIGSLLKSSKVEVNTNWNYISEVFGKYYGEPMESGLYFIMPFGIEKIRAKVFMGEEKVELYLDENKKDKFGGGDVEFSDCSSSITAFFFYKIIDAYKSHYNVSNVNKAIDEKADEILRKFLGGFKLDDAMKQKNTFSIEAIACLASDDIQLRSATREQYMKTEFYETLMGWGVEPKSFSITDISLTPHLREVRESVLAAEKENQVAEINVRKEEIEKKIAIIKATAIREALILKGEGEAAASAKALELIIETLKQKGIPESEISKTVVDLKKWDAVEKLGNTEGNVLVVDNGISDSAASFGVKFAAGTEAYKNKGGKK